MFDKFGQPNGYGQAGPFHDPAAPAAAPRKEQPLAAAVGGFGPSQYPTDPGLAAWRQRSGPPQPIAPQGAMAPPSQGGLGPAVPQANLADPSQWMSMVGNDPQLTDFVSHGLGKNAAIPGRVDYYKGVIHGQPGANPTEQAGSAAYYNNMLGTDPASGVKARAPGARMSPLMSAIAPMSSEPDSQHQYLQQLLASLQQ